MAKRGLTPRIICLCGFEFGFAEQFEESLRGGVEAFFFAVNDA